MKKFLEMASMIICLMLGCTLSGNRDDVKHITKTVAESIVTTGVTTAETTTSKPKTTTTKATTTTSKPTTTTTANTEQPTISSSTTTQATSISVTENIATTVVTTVTESVATKDIQQVANNAQADPSNEGYSTYTNDSYITYVVESGDSVSSIAEQYGCSMYDIKDEKGNYLSSFNIVIGQKLKVPTDGSYNYVEPVANPVDYSGYDNSSYNNYTPSYNNWSDGKVWSNSVTLYTSAGGNSWYNIQLVSNILNAGGWYNYSNGNYTNGYVVGPGETFSFFEVMGPCYGWQGFKSAAAFISETETINVEGGGICFPSTTIFQAARGAGCIPVEWHDHLGRVSYASPGNEAAVDYDGGQDMKFYNPSSTDSIRITMDTSSWGCCTVYVTVE